jgi:hypothetical protein
MYTQFLQALLQQAGINQDPHTLVDQDEAAAILGIKSHTLANWRCTQRYELPYVQIGRRIRYRLGDLLTFAEKNRITPREATTQKKQGANV